MVADNAQRKPRSGLTLNAVLGILFRRKWWVLACCVLGVASAAWMYFTNKPRYISSAKLMVRYVVDGRPVEPTGIEGPVRPLFAQAETIMNAEVEILTSQDLLMEVVAAVGASNILKNTEIPPMTVAAEAVAASRVQRGLEVVAPRRSNIISVSYRGSDGTNCVKVLEALIAAYQKKHLAVHQSKGDWLELRRRATDLQDELTNTESNLNVLKAQAKVTTVGETKALLLSSEARLRESLGTALTERAAQQAKLQELERLLRGRAQTGTNEVAAIEPAVAEHYRVVSSRLVQARQQLTQLMGTFTSKSVLVKNAQELVDELEREKKEMETSNPGLLATLAPRGLGELAAGLDPAAEQSTLASIDGRITELTNQLAGVQSELKRVTEYEGRILMLERQRELQQTNLYYFNGKLEQAQAAAKDNTPNISEIQAPSAPLRDKSTLLKSMIGALLGSFALGIALAFFTELVLDHTVRQPTEVESRLGIPILLSIPEVETLEKFSMDAPARKDAGASGRPQSEAPVPILSSLVDEGRRAPSPSSAPAEEPTDFLPTSSTASAPWDRRHALRDYFDALRDRVMLFFQLEGVKRKPKLVAVTGCSSGVGATTMAAGLAAALSETGDGNVLLVDMNLGRGAVHPFFRGRPNTSLNTVLEPEQREIAQVQENLFVATVDGDTEFVSRPLQTRFHMLMPKMKASDYDYIVFDMPPMSQTSATLALAGAMDQVLLVMEGDKTHREELTRAFQLLKQYNPNVSCLFNKNRAQGPRWLTGAGT